MAKEKKVRASKVSRVLTQARESIKLLEVLEKETLAKARTFVRNPIRVSRRSLTNDTIAASLRSLGVASRSELEKLERKVATLESELHALHSVLAENDSTKRAMLKTSARASLATDSFPNT
jgi:hypothetical protein